VLEVWLGISLGLELDGGNAESAPPLVELGLDRLSSLELRGLVPLSLARRALEREDARLAYHCQAAGVGDSRAESPELDVGLEGALVPDLCKVLLLLVHVLLVLLALGVEMQLVPLAELLSIGELLFPVRDALLEGQLLGGLTDVGLVRLAELLLNLKLAEGLSAVVDVVLLLDEAVLDLHGGLDGVLH